MTTGILNCTASEYHADPLDVPSLSASIAHALIARSPEHAWSQHPRLGNAPRETTAAQDEGSILHALILGKGATIVPVAADSFRTKAAQEARDAAIAEGKIPLVLPKYEEKLNLAMVIKGRLEDAGIDFSAGEPEVAMAWEEVGQYGPVQCRGMMDLAEFGDDYVHITDLKKVASAAPGARERSALDYGLPIQRAGYVSGATKIHPRAAGRVQFRFAFFEDKPPYSVAVVTTTGQFDMYGESRWMRAVELWEECLANDYWPGYATEPLDIPAWAMAYEEMEAGLVD